MIQVEPKMPTSRRRERSMLSELAATRVPDRAEHVLVLDDSLAQRSMMCALLRKWGHTAVPCDCPDVALRLMEDPAITMVLSDWMMPGMTGPEFCRQVRAMVRTDYPYLILLTSKSDAAALTEGLEAGADDFLTKPVNPPELRARLQAGARVVAMQREAVNNNRNLRTALAEIQSLYDAIDNDLNEARWLQQSLLREPYRPFAAADVSLMLKAAGHVGGDMVGYFPVSAHVAGLFALDVSGHGVTSAMIAARIAGMLSDKSPDQNIAIMRRDDGSFAALPPDMAAWRLNALMLQELQTDRYFTLFLGFLNMKTGIVRFVQAGHPHPIVLRVDGTTELVGIPSMPVGLLAEASYTCAEVKLSPGDRMLIYSDGLTECPAPDGTALEEEGLARMMQANVALKGRAYLAALEDGLSAFTGTDDFPDDVSAVLLEYRGISRPA